MEGSVAIWRSARTLYITSLALFLITIVIGILNGIDLVAFGEGDGAVTVEGDLGHQLLLTHLHAGTLGFITLSIVAGAFLMFTEGRDVPERAAATTRNLGFALAGSVMLYIVAFASTQGILRPIAGTLVFIAVAWLFVWVIGRMRGHAITVAQLGVFLAFVSLVMGAVFGIGLGIFVSEGEIPGLPEEAGSRIAEAHPGTMVIGYLILAAFGLIEWLISDEQRLARQDKAGLFQVIVVFIAGLTILVAALADNEDLFTLNVPLEVIGIVTFIVRMRKRLAPSRWLDTISALYARLALPWLIASLAILAYIINGIVSEKWLDFEDIPRGVILAFDHVTFLGAIAMVTFGVVSAFAGVRRAVERWLVVGINVGLVLFVIGLLSDQSVLKRIGTPILGAALITGIVLYIKALLAAEDRPVPAEVA